MVGGTLDRSNESETYGIETGSAANSNLRHSLSKRGSILLSKAFVRSKSKDDKFSNAERHDADSERGEDKDKENVHVNGGGANGGRKSRHENTTSSGYKYHSNGQSIEGNSQHRRRSSKKKRKRPLDRNKSIAAASGPQSGTSVRPRGIERREASGETRSSDRSGYTDTSEHDMSQEIAAAPADSVTASSDAPSNGAATEKVEKSDGKHLVVGTQSIPYNGKLLRSKSLTLPREMNYSKYENQNVDRDLPEPHKDLSELSLEDHKNSREESPTKVETDTENGDSLPLNVSKSPYEGRIKYPSTENSPTRIRKGELSVSKRKSNKESNGSKTAPDSEDADTNGSQNKAADSAAGNVAMSPRKQSIMRYKNEDTPNHTLISEAKENLRGKESQHQYVDEALTSPSNQPPTLNMDDKVSLFICQSSKVHVYHEQALEASPGGDPKTSGRLLGHGALEVFQLHNGDVTYLSCGTSFVYPLLPKLKILRISYNTFVLPLVNPERYWKISIGNDDPETVEKLEKILKEAVCYRNLYIAEPKKEDITVKVSVVPSEPLEEDSDKSHSKPEAKVPVHIVHPTHNESFTNHYKKAEEKNGEKATTYNNKIDNSNGNGNGNGNLGGSSNLLSMTHDIPDSPPSAPLSPNQSGDISSFTLSKPSKNDSWPLYRSVSGNSIGTDVACFDVESPGKLPSIPTNYPSQRIERPVPAQTTNILQPKPKSIRQINPFQQHQDAHETKGFHANNPVTGSSHEHNYSHENQQSLNLKTQNADSKSDTSMDSLLDEYEGNLSSIPQLVSRPPSRPQSRASTSYLANTIQYNRPPVFQGKIDKDEEIKDEDFPSTSLSEYNRIHNGPKSHKSSISEVVDWARTGQSYHNGNGRPQSTLVKSRSSYSIGNSLGGDNLSHTYREIYRSITERNLAQNLNDDDTKSVRSTRSQQQHNHYTPSSSSRSKNPPLSKSAFTPVSLASRTSRNGVGRRYANSVVSERPGGGTASVISASGLSSSDVYKMLSQSKSSNNLRKELKDDRHRKEPVKEATTGGGITSRLFGW